MSGNDSTKARFSDPPSIGLVIDKHGNIKPPHTQFDVELSEQCKRAEQIMRETGDREPYKQWLRDNAARNRELARITAGARS